MDDKNRDEVIIVSTVIQNNMMKKLKISLQLIINHLPGK